MKYHTFENYSLKINALFGTFVTKHLDLSKCCKIPSKILNSVFISIPISSWLPLNLMTLSSELGFSWLSWLFDVAAAAPTMKVALNNVTTFNGTVLVDGSTSLETHLETPSNSYASGQIVYGVLQLLGTANACSNPILYGYLNENFFNEYKNIYRRQEITLT